ncbi:uncharacterized protein JN550_004093 [Neoarthrinium moseri]|uniref:uncharacterized protein n=1 Tax=Neoarthrinium moseri TaxID=1658444 RepID=UPI001FDC96C8|nr:uncharacterized protein JN550_004093 [Neoarthrinium moseri]KAI1872374.1 hypothetical protein JN550_004093 [Neoarthrinium moseri]
MTKPWESYEETIKTLYETHTLATVQEIMEKRYGFKASTRSYRQKLDSWGCTKYKKREKPSKNHSHSQASTTHQSRSPSHVWPEGTSRGSRSPGKRDIPQAATSTVSEAQTYWANQNHQYGASSSPGNGHVPYAAASYTVSNDPAMGAIWNYQAPYGHPPTAQAVANVSYDEMYNAASNPIYYSPDQEDNDAGWNYGSGDGAAGYSHNHPN